MTEKDLETICQHYGIRKQIKKLSEEVFELLLRDLCARLPYGVKCQAHNGTLICVNANNGIAVVQTDRGVSKNHFDICDLIPKGLALEAPKDMYNEIKEEKK